MPVTGINMEDTVGNKTESPLKGFISLGGGLDADEIDKCLYYVGWWVIRIVEK